MNFVAFIPEFDLAYDSAEKEKAWKELGTKFREFWTNRVMAPAPDLTSDDAQHIASPLLRLLAGWTPGDF